MTTKKKLPDPYPKNVREWFAFFGGEELGISLEHASVVWDAATKAINNHNKQFKCPNCGKKHFPKQVYCAKCCTW